MKKKIFTLIIIVLLAIVGYFSDTDKVKLSVKSENELRVHFIDVGQGDCTFIELPGNKTMLIDAGNPENGSEISDYIDALGVNTIDYVIATHPHSDHIGGLAKVVYDFNINNVFMPKVSHNTDLYYELLETIDHKNLKIKTAKAGVVICSDDKIKIEILSPERNKYKEINDYSAVVKLTYLEKTFLFMGDAEKLVEEDLYDNNVDCDVLKVGHHGSSTSNSKEFIRKVSPEIAVITCGNGNEYGHPHVETIVNLSGIKILRTDESGTIVISTDGYKLNIL